MKCEEHSGIRDKFFKESWKIHRQKNIHNGKNKIVILFSTVKRGREEKKFTLLGLSVKKGLLSS